MHVFIVACVTAAILALLAAVVLDKYNTPADAAYATDSVRL